MTICESVSGIGVVIMGEGGGDIQTLSVTT